MAHRQQLLHEMLSEDQEPFELKIHIADKRSQLKKSSPPSTNTLVQFQNRKPIIAEGGGKSRGGNLCRHACFFTFQDVRKSPFPDFSISPAKSPGKSPNDCTVFLHIPSRTAALLLEAAIRIKKQQHPPKSGAPSRHVGFGLLASFVKRLRNRRRNKRQALEDGDFRVKAKESAAKSCSYSNRRVSHAEWTEKNEVKSMDFEASTSSYGSDWSEDHFGFGETRFCESPFRFSFHKSGPSSDGRGTLEFSSPAASPGHHVSKETENHEKYDPGDEDKDQSSPVSVLDAVFQEDDCTESGCCNDGDDDYDIECSHANGQRAKQQLLFRLRIFEKLAELNPMELERKLLEESDDDDTLESEDDSSSSPDTLVTEVFSQSDLQTISADMKKLVCDLIAEEKNNRICSGEAVVGRICKRLDSWKDVELDTIDMMVGLDLKKKERDGWTKFFEQVEETTTEMEVAVCGMLVDELLDELCYMDKVIELLLKVNVRRRYR